MRANVEVLARLLRRWAGWLGLERGRMRREAAGWRLGREASAEFASAILASEAGEVSEGLARLKRKLG